MKGEGYTERKKEEQEKAWGGRKEVICRIGKDKEITSHSHSLHQPLPNLAFQSKMGLEKCFAIVDKGPT